MINRICACTVVAPREAMTERARFGTLGRAKRHRRSSDMITRCTLCHWQSREGYCHIHLYWHTLHPPLGFGHPIEQSYRDVCEILNQTQFSRVLTGSFDKTARIWSVDDGGECLCTMRGHSAEIVAMDVSGPTQSVATSSMDQTTKLFNAVTGQFCCGTCHFHYKEQAMESRRELSYDIGIRDAVYTD